MAIVESDIERMRFKWGEHPEESVDQGLYPTVRRLERNFADLERDLHITRDRYMNYLNVPPGGVVDFSPLLASAYYLNTMGSLPLLNGAVNSTTSHDLHVLQELGYGYRIASETLIDTEGAHISGVNSQALAIAQANVEGIPEGERDLYLAMSFEESVDNLKKYLAALRMPKMPDTMPPDQQLRLGQIVDLRQPYVDGEALLRFKQQELAANTPLSRNKFVIMGFDYASKTFSRVLPVAKRLFPSDTQI